NSSAIWGKNVSANGGFDASLLGEKIQLTAGYYQKDIRDLLYNPALTATAGNADQPYVNVGSKKNNGLDASLSLLGKITDELRYNASLSFTTYNNEIVNISNSANYFSQASNRYEGVSTVRNQVGHPVSSFFGYNI